jgi:maltose alpha-D-glucosyltransferase/alpha-amylase
VSASGSEPRISILEELRAAIPPQLPGYLARQRWFSGKARQIRSSELMDIVQLRPSRLEALFLLARVEYESGPGETYVLPMLSQEAPTGSQAVTDGSSFMSVGSAGKKRGLILTDALENHEVLEGLLQAIRQNSSFQGIRGEVRASRTKELQHLFPPSGNGLTPKLLKGEQSNSSIVFGENLILKIFRRLEAGMNPDLEVGLFLTEKARFKNIPPVAGSLEYHAQDGQSATIGILQGFVPNQGDAWRFTLQCLASFWQDVSAASAGPPGPLPRNTELGFPRKPTNFFLPSLDSYLEAIGLLAKRTAQMHQALNSDPSDPAFALEPYSAHFQRSLEKSIGDLTERNIGLLRQRENDLPEEARFRAEEILNREADILERIHSTLGSSITGARIRIHGDYHLGQVLYTGSDFMIIDFEGEPARSLAERRTKRSPLQDVAGMLRSFHYAAFASWMSPSPGTKHPLGSADYLNSWAETWAAWVSSGFLTSYLEESGTAAYLPSDRKKLMDLLQLHILEKAIYELGYELNNRPAWVGIPLAGIQLLLNS